MMIAGTWPYRWARETGRQQLVEGLRVVTLDEVALYRKLTALGAHPTALDQLAYREGQQNHPALQAITAELARHTQDFEPDVIISFAVQIDFLAALWPNALRLHTETGPLSRSPYPFSLFFDHLGMYGRSIVGQAGTRLRAQAAAGDMHDLVSALRARNTLTMHAVDPFRSVDFRKRFERLLLLPLQVSNYYSFDEQTHYRTQFEYLLDVLSASPRDVGVIVTEYIEWGHIFRSYGSAENMPYLQANFPNLIFLDQFRAYSSPSQFLAPRVDGVWSVSSNVAYQALLYNRLLGSPATSHLAGIAHATSFDSFFNALDCSAPLDNDAVLAWLLERYLVPEALLANGRWLRDYLARRAEAAANAGDPLDAFVPIADAARLREAWVVRAPNSRAAKFVQPLDEALANARVARQSLDAVLHSKSWRITAPLRAFSSAARTCRDHIAARLPARKQRELALGRSFLPAP